MAVTNIPPTLLALLFQTSENRTHTHTHTNLNAQSFKPTQTFKYADTGSCQNIQLDLSVSVLKGPSSLEFQTPNGLYIIF